jgi:hypothetical protein
VKLECAENIAVVGHRNRRHIHRRNLLSKNRNLDRRIQQRIVGVEVEVYERRYFGMPGHAAMIPRPTNLAPPQPPLSSGLLGPNPFPRYDSSKYAAIPGQIGSRFQECPNELSDRSIFILLLQLELQLIDIFRSMKIILMSFLDKNFFFGHSRIQNGKRTRTLSPQFNTLAPR